MTAQDKKKRSVHWPAVLDASMIYGGAIIIVLIVTYMAASPYEETVFVNQLQIAMVGVGLLINQVGVWHLASYVTSGRKYLPLRDEVCDFIKLVRSMHTLVLAGDRKGVEQLKLEMHESVDRMIASAGKTGSVDAAGEK